MGEKLFLLSFLVIIILIGVSKIIFEGFSMRILIALILSVIIVGLLWIKPILIKKWTKPRDLD